MIKNSNEKKLFRASLVCQPADASFAPRARVDATRAVPSLITLASWV